VVKASYFSLMREAFLKEAQASGYEAIDMQQVFIEHYQKHKERFEWPIDNHWNGVAHGVAADAVERSQTFGRVFHQ
jgi:hypothetical protein